MNLLFIGYWSVSDGLSEATIKPHLEVLSSFDRINAIYFVSIERSPRPVSFHWNIAKVTHLPYYSGHNKFYKIQELYKITSYLVKICRIKEITALLARASPAGIYTYLAHRKTGIPYYVESFEPHADYMNSSGVWRKWDPRYLLQKHFEKKMKYTASGLMPVSNAFKDILLQDPRILCPVESLPCTVDLEKFKPDVDLGKSTREKLGFIQNEIVGVYVGKFGDIYFNKEAYIWFAEIKKNIRNFKLIILTGQDKEQIAQQLVQLGFSQSDYFIDNVPHIEVPAYLNAANLAFCLHKPHSFSHAYSPIKNGEYWGCGLPVIIAQNIGDDSEILASTKLGFVIKNRRDIFKIDNIHKCSKSKLIRNIAKKYRNPNLIKPIYKQLLFNLNKDIEH